MVYPYFTRGEPVADITILICTRNRASQLALTLESLVQAIANLRNAEVEVVLVNNGSSDNTQAVIDVWAKDQEFKVLNILETTPGLSCARNTGIKNSSGRLIVFTDDDCTLNPDYLTVLASNYFNDSPPVIRGGRVELGNPTDAPFTILLVDSKKRMDDETFPSGFIIGANMIVPRKLFDSIGNFDERFGAGAIFKAGEESDFIYRAYKQGIAVEYVPDLIIYHYHGRKNISDIARLSEGYFIGGGAMYAKHICDFKLLRHLYWDVRKYIVGIIRGNTMVNEELGINYRKMLSANFKGMLLYFVLSLKKKKVSS